MQQQKHQHEVFGFSVYRTVDYQTIPRLSNSSSLLCDQYRRPASGQDSNPVSIPDQLPLSRSLLDVEWSSSSSSRDSRRSTRRSPRRASSSTMSQDCRTNTTYQHLLFHNFPKLTEIFSYQVARQPRSLLSCCGGGACCGA